MSIATSRDLFHWTKHGPAFRKHAPDKVMGSRTGVVVSRRESDRMIAAKIDGKYWMYYHHNNFIATSDNLIDWHPYKENGHPKSVMEFPRPGYYDAGSGEPGTAMIRNDGILLMINGSNSGPGEGDPDLPAYAWSIGQTLIDKSDPTKLLKRADEPTIHAVEKWEREGFSSNCTVMHDGMVHFHQELVE